MFTVHADWGCERLCVEVGQKNCNDFCRTKWQPGLFGKCVMTRAWLPPHDNPLQNYCCCYYDD